MKKIITLTGPSLAGKSHMAQLLVKEKDCVEVVSTTTRPMRNGEIDGVSYHFISKEEFIKRKDNNDFIENVEVNGNYYGVSKTEIERIFSLNKIPVLVVEPNGAVAITEYGKKNQLYDTLKVFINNPLDVLMSRFIDRIKNDLSNENANKEKILMTHISRLESMLKVEHEKWVKPALQNKLTLNSDLTYDVNIQEFTPSVQENVVEQILEKYHKNNKSLKLK